jgi:hypothetical protein
MGEASHLAVSYATYKNMLLRINIGALAVLPISFNQFRLVRKSDKKDESSFYAVYYLGLRLDIKNILGEFVSNIRIIKQISGRSDLPWSPVPAPESRARNI